MSELINLVILGASGDLTHRLLLPGLGTLLKGHRDLTINLIGAAADEWTDEHWREVVAKALTDGGCSGDRMKPLIELSRYERVDATSADDLGRLVSAPGRTVLYFALPPAVTMAACRALAGMDLPDELFLAIEKPFGTDAASAHEFNRLLTQVAPEDHIFRIDHYLGKATVLNLLGLRFTNRIIEPVWNADNIERIEIITDEALALEGRAGYYDKAGALKDMIQSHLLLVMAMLCMEGPARIEAGELRDLQLHVLRATRVWQGDPVTSTRRARYVAGRIDGKDVPNYVDEPGVDAARNTETLAEVTVEVRNNRWAGVPIRLRSGKALGDGLRNISVVFKPLAYQPEGFRNPAPQNVIAIGLAPEYINVGLSTNAEGDKLDLELSVLSTDLGESAIRPYGEILDHILRGDPLLSVRGDIAEECWRIVTPVLDAWREGLVPMDEYRAGSTGPDSWT
ncbi:MAG TPA: glucose-6-phosphate dehydrogenase [Propionibacteriaceae bacterium]|nr:glucose-6-phosphate dehydrogenase [Propionibacteriaceae bacterium]